MNEIIVTVEVYQHNPPGQLRVSERINLGREISIKEAADILTKFAELAKSIQR